MGLNVVLETERGEPLEEVGDPTNLLHRLLPSQDDPSYKYLRFIDWYGDTIFNRLQIEPFLAEWQRLLNKARTIEESALLEEIKRLAERCRSEPHTYLKFYGD